MTGTATTSQPTQVLASFLASLRHEDLPGEVVGRAEEFLLDRVAPGSVEGAKQPTREAERRGES